MFLRYIFGESRLLGFKDVPEGARTNREADMTPEERDRQKEKVRDEVSDALHAFRGSFQLLPEKDDPDVRKRFDATMQSVLRQYGSFRDLDIADLEALRSSAFENLSPYLAKAAEVLQKQFPTLQRIRFSPEGMHFIVGAEPMTAVLNEDLTMKSVWVRGANMAFRTPVRLDTFDQAEGKQIPLVLDRIAARFGAKALDGLLITKMDELRHEFTVTVDGKAKDFVVTTDDVLQVIRVQTQNEKWDSDMLERQIRETKDLIAKAEKEVRHYISLPKELRRNLYYPEPDIEEKFKKILAGSLDYTTIEAKKYWPPWGRYLTLRKELDEDTQAFDAASLFRGKRLLTSADGTQVIEEMNPDVQGRYSWSYRDAKGNTTKTVHFNNGVIVTPEKKESPDSPASPAPTPEKTAPQTLAEKYMSEHAKGLRKNPFVDPALKHWEDVKDEWIDWNEITDPSATPAQREVWHLQMRALVARNLFFRNEEVNEETVRAEFRRILELRETYAKTELFRGRNVLHIAHSEHIRDVNDDTGKPFGEKRYQDMEAQAGDVRRFGKKGLQKAICDEGGASYKLIRPETQKASLEQAKKDTLRNIQLMRPPATFVFEGHGTADAFYFEGGSSPIDDTPRPVQGNDVPVEAVPGGAVRAFGLSPSYQDPSADRVRITVDELAEALNKRARAYPAARMRGPGGKDILIFDCCYNATFIRSLYAKLDPQARPISLGASEYDQLAYSRLESPLSSPFFSSVLGLGDAGEKPVTFADVFQNEFKGTSNPSLFIPDEKGLPMQITQKESEGDERINS